MNQITIEANVVETETSTLEAMEARLSQDELIELNSAQMLLVGGGSGTAVLI